jgi:hypothetical protein
MVVSPNSESRARSVLVDAKLGFRKLASISHMLGDSACLCQSQSFASIREHCRSCTWLGRKPSHEARSSTGKL